MHTLKSNWQLMALEETLWRRWFTKWKIAQCGWPNTMCKSCKKSRGSFWIKPLLINGKSWACVIIKLLMEYFPCLCPWHSVRKSESQQQSWCWCMTWYKLEATEGVGETRTSTDTGFSWHCSSFLDTKLHFKINSLKDEEGKFVLFVFIDIWLHQ